MANPSDTPAAAVKEDQPQPTPEKPEEKPTETPGTTIIKNVEPTTSTPSASSTDPPTTKTTADDDAVNADFQGEVLTDNTLPSLETLRRIEKLNVLDAAGKSRSFKSLYAGQNTPRRLLIIFVRHFFCGMCQQYLRTLSDAITPDALLELPVSTFITVIGCGSPALIPEYVEKTGCPFPVYADPTRSLYKELGMVRTLSMGPQPDYMRGRSLAQTVISGVAQGLKHIRTGLVTKMGDTRQVGGEFLFEPDDVYSPVSTPVKEEDHHQQLQLSKTLAAERCNDTTTTTTTMQEDDRPDNTHDNEPVREEKRVTWCHRMRTTRDHAEIPELLEVLGLPQQQQSSRSQGGDGANGGAAAADAAKTRRKGTGLSLASQMGSMRSATGDTTGMPVAVAASSEEGSGK